MLRQRFKVCLAGLALAALAACGAPAAPHFHATDVTGSALGSDFTLKDPQGRTRSLKDYRGQAVILFFGYLHCPDYCPTTLVTLNQAAARLGPLAARTRVLFVTVDPARDTPSVLRDYVTSFNPRFVGLYGTPAETARVTRAFRVLVEKRGEGANYTIDHSAGLFVFDPEGRLRLFAGADKTAAEIADDVAQLLGAKRAEQAD